MPSLNDGGPAYPRTGVGNAGVTYDVPPQDGMSLRDYLAGQALAGLLASSRSWTLGEVAAFAYRYADEMLKERDKCTT